MANENRPPVSLMEREGMELGDEELLAVEVKHCPAA